MSDQLSSADRDSARGAVSVPARDASPEAFSVWARERQGALLRLAVLVSGDRQRAEDLVQDALTKVALRWGRLHDQNPDAYARQVIARTHVSWWRRTRRETALEHLPETHGLDPSHAVERRLLLDRALAALTPRQRAVVVLRYYEDLTVAHVADTLGVSTGTVKSQTHLALRRMREAEPGLADLLPEETS